MCSVPEIGVGLSVELLFGMVGGEVFDSIVVVSSEFFVLVVGGHVVVTVLGGFV